MTDQIWYDNGAPGRAWRDCLAAATAAPSIHNTQPWLFRVGRGTVDILADSKRRLPRVDPQGREMYVSVGAAVFNLVVAVRAHGRRTHVRLMPDWRRPDVVARLKLGPALAPVESVQALYAAIPRRHTNRRPFRDRPVPADVLADLSTAAQREGASVMVADPALRAAVWSLVRTADNSLRDDPAYLTELAAWTTPGGAAARRDGVPRQAFGPRDVRQAIPLRDFGRASGAPTATVRFEPDPTLLLLFAAGDSPGDWVTAGMALERILLTATVRGLAATPLSQVVEVPPLRALLADPSHEHVLQTVLRIGYPETETLSTPRRPVDEVLLS